MKRPMFVSNIGATIALVLATVASNSTVADSPEMDTTPEVAAVAVQGGGVIVVVLEDQSVYRVRGTRSSVLNIRTDERSIEIMDACSRSSTTADQRTQCESVKRIDLPQLAADAASATQPAAFSFDRQSVTEGIANITAASRAIRVPIVTTDDVLTRVRQLGVTSAGHSVLLVESLRQRQGVLRFRAVVASYDGNGRRLGVLELDGKEENLPNGDYVVVNERGDVGVIKLIGRKPTVSWRTLRPELSAADERSGEKETPPPEPVDTFDYKGFARKSAELDGDGARASDGPITRKEILANSDVFARVKWVMSEANYAHPDRPSSCSPAKGLVWRRPARFEHTQGQLQTRMGYKWGGFASENGYLKALGRGDLAGNVCTCSDPKQNYCIVPEATGIDCSGFVSRVWEVDRHTTRDLHEISNAVKWRDLQAGDIVNFAGSHVRLFLNISWGADIGFRIIESSVSCGGICEKTLGAREMEGYEPRRYKFIVD
jgi:hypothetical protein